MWIEDILAKKKPILALSPMADMTDSAFCQVVRRIGGADVVYREMVSSEAVVRDNVKTLGMTDFVEGERPIVQQILVQIHSLWHAQPQLLWNMLAPKGLILTWGARCTKLPVISMVAR